MKNLGEKLRKARTAAGLTQEAVAGKRMATRTLQRLEDGDGNPTFSTLQELAGALGVRVSDLLDGEPSISPFSLAAVAELLLKIARMSVPRKALVLALIHDDESYLSVLGSDLAQGVSFLLKEPKLKA